MKSQVNQLPPHIRLGKAGEDAASSYLETNNYTILERNWRYGKLELDIICLKNGSLVFVEVKTRQNNSYGGPEGAITYKKKQRLLKCAMRWINLNSAWQYPARFDVICFTFCGNKTHLEHYRNAFDLSTSLDHSNSPWQPW